MSAASNILRYKIERKNCLSPDLHQVGWAIFTEPVHDKENLPAHIHKNDYEICYIAHGGVDWWIEDKMFEVKPGEVFITFPGERHGGLHDIMNPCELYWAQIHLPDKGNLAGLSQKETSILAKKYADIHSHTFPARPEVPSHFKNIVDLHRTQSEYNVIIVRAVIIELLISVLSSYEEHIQKNMAHSEYSKPIQTALKLIDKNIGSNIRMDQIAQQTGLSTTQFYQQFSNQVHLTPGEYLTQQRIHKAKKLLRDTNMNITQIAHHLGYSSSQYMATIFKRTVGISPSKFRSKNLND